MKITTEEYRKILKDYSTSEEVIQKRLEYLVAFCRNIAKSEIEKELLLHARDLSSEVVKKK